MPYQGSTQSLGFKRITVASDAARTREYANKLAQRGSEKVQSLAEQAQGQQQEIQRIDTITTKQEQDQLEQLRGFSKTLNNLLDTAATQIGKPYIDQKRKEGIAIAEGYEAGDPEAKEKIDVSKAQLAEIDKKVKIQQLKAEELGQKWDAKIAQGYKASLIEKERLHNVRKLGSNVRWGFIKGTLLEAAKGYPSWRDTQLSTSTEKTENGLTVGEYYSYEVGSEERKEILNYVKNEYAKKGDFAGKSAQLNYLITPMSASDKKLREVNLQKANQDLGYTLQQDYTKEFDILGDEIQVDVGDDDQLSPISTGKLQAQIQAGITNGPGYENLKGGQGSSKERNKVFLKDTISRVLSRMNQDDRTVILKSVSGMTFDVPGVGKLTLEQLFGRDFSIEELEAKAIAVQSTELAKKHTDRLNVIKGEVAELDAKFVNGDLDLKGRDLRLRELLRDNSDVIGVNQLITSAIGRDFEIVSAKVAEAEAIDLLEKHGEIKKSETVTWPSDVREKYEKAGKIVDDYFATDTLTGRQELQASTNSLKNKLNSVRKKLTKEEVPKNDLDRANSKARLKVISLAKKLYADRNTELEDQFNIEATTESEAVRLATQIVLNEIEQGKDEKGSLWEVDADGSGFLHESLRDPDIDINAQDLVDSGLKKQKRALNRAEELSEEKGIDVISKTQIIDKGLLEPSETGKIAQVVKSLTHSKANTEGYTLYQVLNKQRALHNLLPIDDPNTEIDEALKTLPKADRIELQQSIAAGDDKSVCLITDKYGAVDIRKSHETFLSTNINSPIFATENLPGLIQAAGLDISVADLANNPQAQEKLQRYVINDLLTKAAAKTNNQTTLLRMLASGLKGGESEMDNYLSDENKEYSLNFARAYRSGNFELLQTSEEDYQGGTVAAIEPGKDFVTRTTLGVEVRDDVPLKLRTALDQPIGTDIKDLKSQLKELKVIENEWRKSRPDFEWSEKSIATGFGGSRYPIRVKNQAHEIYLERKIQVESRLRILEGRFSENERLELYQSIANVVGEDALAKYRAQGIALGYAPIGPKMNRFLIDMAKQDASFLGKEFTTGGIE